MEKFIVINNFQKEIWLLTRIVLKNLIVKFLKSYKNLKYDETKNTQCTFFQNGLGVSNVKMVCSKNLIGTMLDLVYHFSVIQFLVKMMFENRIHDKKSK